MTHSFPPRPSPDLRFERLARAPRRRAQDRVVHQALLLQPAAGGLGLGVALGRQRPVEIRLPGRGRLGVGVAQEDQFAHRAGQTGSGEWGMGNEGTRGTARRPVLEDRGYRVRSEEQTSELQSLMRISYAVFCLKKQTNTNK